MEKKPVKLEKKKRGRIENLKKINERTPEERKEICRRGAMAATETKRRKKEMVANDMAARDFVRCYLAMRATQETETLQMLGFEENECINMNLFVSALFSKAVHGDTRAAELLMTLAGYTGEENRRNAEQARKTLESAARIEALKANTGAVDVTSGDDEGSVIIYLPELDPPEEEEE